MFCPTRCLTLCICLFVCDESTCLDGRQNHTALSCSFAHSTRTYTKKRSKMIEFSFCFPTARHTTQMPIQITQLHAFAARMQFAWRTFTNMKYILSIGRERKKNKCRIEQYFRFGHTVGAKLCKSTKQIKLAARR